MRRAIRLPVSLACLSVVMSIIATERPTGAADVVIPPATYAPPKGYVCLRASSPIEIDGKLDEAAWRAAPWTEEFGDIEGDRKPRPTFRTRAKMLWTDQGLYVGADMDEPHVWGTITRHDSVIFHENDFEVFLDPDGDSHNYGEFEMNAINGTWDLRLNKPYKDGGKADDGWEIPGVRSATHVRGTLNDPSDVDEGWSVEIFFPWNMLATLADPLAPVREAQRDGSLFREYAPPLVPSAQGWKPLSEDAQSYSARHAKEVRKLAESPPAPALIPRDGQYWRINFSRVEWQVEVSEGKYRRVPNRAENNWVWSPQAKIDMHRPETWGYLQFSSVAADHPDARKVVFRPDPTGPARHILSRVYYAQHAFRQKQQRFATSLAELEPLLELDSLAHASLQHPIELKGDGKSFRVQACVSINDSQTSRITLSDDARFEVSPP